jgi:hypothetical protein
MGKRAKKYTKSIQKQRNFKKKSVFNEKMLDGAFLFMV